MFYTSDQSGPEVLEGGGGTSFVAPQLNGVTALLSQSLHGARLGLLNCPLYSLALAGQAYKRLHAPLHVISTGDNWFYQGRNGYRPAAGLGTIDVANFAQFLRNLFEHVRFRASAFHLSGRLRDASRGVFFFTSNSPPHALARCRCQTV